MKISVAMCTYNGAPFVINQLDSIVKQARYPDELIIVDDCSTDKTKEILNNYEGKASFKIKLFSNPANLGVPKNFERAIGLCTGDIIVLSDQDDIWKENKLSLIESIYSNNTDIDYIFSNATIIGANNKDIKGNIFNSSGFSLLNKYRFKYLNPFILLLHSDVVTGATLSFRKRIVQFILPIPKEWIHDAWIAAVCSCLGIKGTYINDSILFYRIHSSQYIGINKKISIKKRARNNRTYGLYEKRRLYYRQLFDHIIFLIKKFNIVSHKAHRNTIFIMKGISHYKTREIIWQKKSIGMYLSIVQEILNLNYFRFSRGFGSVAKDISCIIMKS